MTGNQPQMIIDSLSVHLVWYFEFLISTIIILFPDDVNRPAGHSRRKVLSWFFLI